MPQPFQGLHTKNLVYVEYVNTTREREFYNLDDDPYEQTSIVDTADPELLSHLAAWLEALRHCAGASCRAAEDTPP